ncbi:MAG TPA: hypothetical protein VNY27_09560 [Solirubrobacteraceae bacterium]|jgi:hypothetical protein|nr:hypothetical protein [Solirubrobacteraceae bacterium]
MSTRVLRSAGGIVLAVAVLALTPASAVASSAERKPFAVESFTLQTTQTREVSEGGGVNFVNEPYSYTQAGGHPSGLTATLRLATEEVEAAGGSLVPTQDPKDVVVNLPPGLLGNPTAVPRCPLSLLEEGKACPTDTQVGFFTFARLGAAAQDRQLGPIVNVVPEAGQSAEFALETPNNVSVLLTAHVVRVGSGYGLTVVSNAIPIVRLWEVETTFWGVPADPSHDRLRGVRCKPGLGQPMCPSGEPSTPAGIAPVPFLTMPSDCAAGPEVASVRADSWEELGVYKEAPLPPTLPAATGCDLLSFNPAIEVQPDTLLADAPMGVGVNLQVPQVEEPEAKATPPLRNAVVTLPEGVSISPGIVDGIQACNRSGPEGINFTGPESEEVGLNGELQLAPGKCPDASIVGTAEAVTPLLSEPVKGHMYLARPACGGPGEAPCSEADALDGKLYRLYLELGGTGPLGNTGVNIKVPGDVEANPATGQLTTKFLENPQFPFSELRIHLNGGPRAPLDTPAVCGPAVTTTDFTPWSAPGITGEGLVVAGTADATPSSFFQVTGCPGSPGLSPGFVAGTVTPQAGQFSAFTLNLSRQDREQYVKGIQLHTPPGLIGMLSSVQLCDEPQANEGTCPQAARIGSTRVASGAGSHPFEISGSVYLTKGYGGAPFGLSIVTNAVAGPFNLGLVVVRARIAVDPEDSTLTVTTDETGPHAIPQILDGVPLRLQRVTVNVDRPGFMFNPTNCRALRITAAISGNQNATANVSSPFAVGGCKSLAFKPVFAVSTSGKTSKVNGASLDAKVSYPAGSFGNQANIAYVKVELPKQLPSRLTTLQKACLAAVFEANPARCPAASVIGIVRTSTPVLPVPFSGPVYFVSHGGEAFPSLVAVLQGDGVRVDLTGTTFIDKHGVTSSTFKTVPDVPVNTFELYLPQGPYSALAANTNLCAAASKLKMPTEFVGQNGAVIKQSTQIQVTGCAGARTARKARRARKARHASHRRSGG